MKPDTKIGTAVEITLKVDRKNKEKPIIITPDPCKVQGGQKVVWRFIGKRDPFTISFEAYKNNGNKGHQSPFPKDTFTDDTALAPQETLWGGEFRYSVTLTDHPMVVVDPVVVVVPPTYPPQ